MEFVPRIEEMSDGHILTPDEQELFEYTMRDERSHFASELPADIQEEVSATFTRETEVRHVVQPRELPARDGRPQPEPEPAPAGAVEESEPAGPADFRPPPDRERPDWAKKKD